MAEDDEDTSPQPGELDDTGDSVGDEGTDAGLDL